EERKETLVINKGMAALVTVSSIAIIGIGIYPSLLMELAQNSIPF
ncbi:MAG: hypothetical protein GWM98_26395, partial [Nitrospinaceae bacterium]|nr:hypothetical protein [Nitrospinaceae bacterium]NIR57356.1 hypothetical protein [Nitrospinaceae bacterium]NIS87808.1 hypothetical protein [Nitrospinaceae bacterium]NIT84678.1 hypothetical protein [Nitrospinaceae bacterium]NIU46857.1 hypothetical protein [Nitrospinaceae bacterium]